MRAVIFVTDDEQANRAAIVKRLTRQGHRAEGYESGEALLEALRHDLPDLVLLDLKMPGLNGLDTLKSVRQLGPSAMVIMLTAYGTVQDAVEAMKLWGVRFSDQVGRSGGHRSGGVQPMNQLPQTFAGKVDAYTMLLEQGVIDQKKFLRMVEIPDDRRDVDLLTSSENIILRNIHFMLKTGKLLPPLPYDDFDLIIRLTTAFINDYRTKEGADLTKVSLLGAYIDAAVQMKGGPGNEDPNAIVAPEMGAGGPEMAAAGGTMAAGMPPEGLPPPGAMGQAIAPPGPPGEALPPPGMEGMMGGMPPGMPPPGMPPGMPPM